MFFRLSSAHRTISRQVARKLALWIQRGRARRVLNRSPSTFFNPGRAFKARKVRTSPLGQVTRSSGEDAASAVRTAGLNRITRAVFDHFTRQMGPGVTDVTPLTSAI